MHDADYQNGDVGMGEVTEHGSCIGHAPCSSYPGSAESHVADNFPTGAAIDGVIQGKLAETEDASRGLYNENLNSVSVSAGHQFEPRGVQTGARNTRSLTQFAEVGNGERLQLGEGIQKGRLLLLEELADILACIFAEVPTTGRSGSPVENNSSSAQVGREQ